MNALILAAGRGTRLRTRHERPKCLLEINGTALIDRYVRTLESIGVDITIVAGYRADDVQARITRLAPAVGCSVVINASYELGSIVSLARGLETVDGSLLLLDGDVLFHHDLLTRLAASPHDNALLVDVGSAFTGEEYMTGIENGRVHALRRAAVEGYAETGEWVGFARLEGDAVNRLRAAIERQIAAGETAGGYEDALASLLPDVYMHVENAADLPWVEIDFPEDAAHGEALVRAGLL
jgi:choline kinase